MKINYNEKPVLVGSLFNGLEIAANEFDLYKNKKDDYILHGESENLDYNGETNNDDFKYILGVYDEDKKAVEIYKTIYLPTKVTAKRNRVYKGPSVKQQGIKNLQQRQALGEAFGTKKAKQAITNLEKNRIDADKLQDVELDISESIVPIKIEQQSNSPLPKVDTEATNVENVYKLKDVVPLHLITIVGTLDSFPSQPPFVKKLYETANQKVLYYASLLFAFYQNKSIKKKDDLIEKLNSPSEALVDYLIQNFTTNKSSTFGKNKKNNFIVDPFHENKLLIHLIIILFHLNSFILELNSYSAQLKLKNSKMLTLARSTGAIIRSASVGECEGFGITRSQAANYKIAQLKVPFKLPELSRKRR
ncbi:unnamed protein product [Candida verbasci]|uniref:DNA-directed RNA polymerase I subunit RPA49 n=1 Tax=Candida verbasci TaxID=1227364 RepID=A0A9W4TQF6_9ASCO|nr:unnamed protein product [Candida verbasci]